MLEKEVEKYLCKRVKEIGGLCEKFTSPSNRSVPDRIITLPEANILFVELKSSAGEVSKAQKHDHLKRLYLGVHVHVINSKEQVDQFISHCQRMYKL